MERQKKLNGKGAFAIISSCINVVLLAMLISVWAEGHDTASCPEGFRQYDSSTLMLCEPDSGSELALAIPNTVSLAEDGQPIVFLEYADVDHSILKNMSLWGPDLKPWITVELEDRSMIYNIYDDDTDKDPSVSLRDKNGDGIPDVKVDWNMKQRFDRVGEIEWKRVSKDEGLP